MESLTGSLMEGLMGSVTGSLMGSLMERLLSGSKEILPTMDCGRPI